jgi:hypothetical protein
MPMSLSPAQLEEVRQLQRPFDQWFSIDEIVKRDQDLLASRFIHRDSGQEISFPHAAQDIYRKLEVWASRLLEQELRAYEARIAEKYVVESLTPTSDDDVAVAAIVTLYLQNSVDAIREKIADFSQYQVQDWENSWSSLRKMARRLRSELTVTIPLNGELTRLELAETGYEPLDRIGYAQTKMERFYSHYGRIPHPFDSAQSLVLSSDELKRAVRLLSYVVFRTVSEPRLSGYENKFVSAFSRYLTCPRDASSSTVEQVASLFEPFLKKAAFLFDVRGATGNPLWGMGLTDLLPKMLLVSADLKKDDALYWGTQKTEDAVFRVAFQLRHAGAHEAHDAPFYERERHAYFVFAALLIACLILIKTNSKVLDVVQHQGHVDFVRDLLVKIEELVEGPYGPRIDVEKSTNLTRLGKLLRFAERAQALWPTCSTALAEALDSEYLSVKEELTEEDREADIESYLEDMRGSQY